MSAEAQASIAIIAGPLTDRITITGRVILDNPNHGWSGITGGVPGVRIYMEDGTSVLTDSDGRFTFPDVRPGIHVLRLDTATLPRGVHAFDDRRYDSPRSTIRLVHGLMDTKLIQDVNFVVEGSL